MKLPTIAITQPTLPSPLPTDFQRLVDCFYDHWQALSAQVRDNNAALGKGCCDVFINPSIAGMMRSPYQNEIAAVMPAKVNAAVALANANYQIGNGGFSQYHDNGYSAGLPTVVQLLTGAAALGVPQAAETLVIFEEFGERLRVEEEDTRRASRWNGEDEPDFGEDRDPYGDLDTRYYELQTEALCQAVLDRFQTILEASFRPVLKKAA